MQEINGFLTEGKLPKEADKYTGNLIILGSGLNVWDEFKQAKGIFDSYDLMVINLTYFGLEMLHRLNKEPIKHWSSLHSDFFKVFNETRQHGILTHSNKEGADCVWPVNDEGTSGLFSLKVGLLLGYTKIILCGMPLDNTRKYYDAPWSTCDCNDRAVEIAWTLFVKDFGLKDKVRSLSGKTKQLLGEPNKIWAYD